MMPEKIFAPLKTLLDLVQFHLFTDHGVSVPVSRTKSDFQPNIWSDNEEIAFKIAKSILPKNHSKEVLERLHGLFPGKDFGSFAVFEETVVDDTEEKYKSLVNNFLDQMKKDQEPGKKNKLKNIPNIENATQEILTSANDKDLDDDDLNTTTVTPNDNLSADELEAYLKISLILKKIRRNIQSGNN